MRQTDWPVFYIRMPPDLARAAKTAAEAEDRSVAWLVRQAVARYLGWPERDGGGAGPRPPIINGMSRRAS